VTVETTDKFLPFRGALRAALGHGPVLVFVTVHPEGQPTAVYRLDVDKGELLESALPAGGVAITAADGAIFVAGTDGHIHRGNDLGGPLSPLGDKLDPKPTALAVLSQGRLAALSGDRIAILDRQTGKVSQILPLPEAGSALAADSSGVFLVAGTARGTVVVFDGEDKPELLAAESKKIHEGAVSALLFDPDELRVYSSGSDNRLLLTHVRGALEPEDRASGAAHEGLIQAIALGPEDKLYTAGRDGALKTWSRGQKKRPSTFKEGVGIGVALVRVPRKGRAHLALFAEDQTIRLFPLDAAGKINARAVIFHDAYALAEHAFAEREPKAREAALKALAGYNDARAIEILTRRAVEDPDHGLRALATTLIGASKNPRAGKSLEGLLQASEEQVRLAALGGLRALYGEASLRPLELALGVQKRDIGVAAVTALTELARADDQAMARLVQALDEDPIEVRAAALGGLEALFPPSDSESVRIALRSKRPDIRRLALVRAFQRKLLGSSEVQAALRRHQGDADADVRRAAFLVSVMSRPALAEALRAQDRDLHQKLGELETFGQKAPAAAAAGEAPAPKAEPKAAQKGKKARAEPLLSEADVRPLLEAMASRALDTCLLGARGLASLKDERAFGTLLQLTNEKAPQARIEACKALSDLGDPRGLPRLRQMLRDPAGEVRDAAFSALARLEEKSPESAAKAGLMAPNEDVRGRGLQLLVRQLKKAPNEGVDSPLVGLLERALNDTSAAVRGEAWKAVLSLEIGGGGKETLRFALRSIHAEVRREVLGEVMGRIQEPWAPGLLLEIFADPDAGVRGEAFEFSQKRSKGRAAEPLAAALEGRHVDLKRKAIAVLEKRRVDGARELLLRALGDEDEQVRIAAVDALLGEEAAGAMESAHPDVRVRAAASRALYGDPRALAPLIALVTDKEPERAELREGYLDRTVRALRGLADLGAPEAEGPVAALVLHKDKRVSVAAVEALGAVSRPGSNLGPLRAALGFVDNDVKLAAAFGLAMNLDASGLPLLKGLADARGDAARRGLAAALALFDQAADLFMAFLDHAEENVRNRALVLMMLIESSEQDAVPDRCLSALASAHPRIRLTAARALEAFSDTKTFEAFVLALLNDRGDDRAPFTIASEIARAFGEIFAHGDSHLKVRAARVLDALDDEKQDRFDRTFAVFRRRFAGPIDALLAAAARRKPAPPEYTADELRRVVFGAYAGLSRMGGGNLEVRVRQTAISRLTGMAQAEPGLAEAVGSILQLALGDPHATVRRLAFDSLAALGTPVTALGAEALAVGHRDMGVAGLKLLAERGEGASRQKVLEEVLQNHTDGLEEEAQKLLAEPLGWIEALTQGLSARSPALRERSVAGLAQRWEEGEAARTALRGALGSRYRHVSERAALELGGKKDPAALSSLVAMLDTEKQAEAEGALTRLGDPRAAMAFLDRIERDPAGTARVDALLAAAGAFRAVEVTPRLLRFLEDKKKRRAAFSALLAVSGYDQPIVDPNDELAPTGTPPRAEHPRRDDVLAKILDAAYRLGEPSLLTQLLPSARWARGAEVDPVLAPLATFSKDDVRDLAVEALGFRLRKRGGAAEPLLAAVAHASPRTQLLAAEGLALAGRAEGIRVLLTAIDLSPELADRVRAVRALGALADPRALDPLLRLVNEDGHALQEEAAEAIGHLRLTAKGPQIEALLLRLGRGSGGVAQRALTGLRWFDSREGWSLIRGRIRDDEAAIRLKVAELLAADPDPASREALIQRIEEDPDRNVARRAAQSLRKLDGPDAIELDYVLVRARFGGLEERTVERLKARGDPGRILDVLPRIPDSLSGVYLGPLEAALLARDPLPLEAAAARLESPHERIAAVAAQILGRAGKAAQAPYGARLTGALKKAGAAWIKARAEVDRGKDELGPHTERYRRMIAAAGKLSVAAEEVIAAAALGGEDPRARLLRIEALLALSSGFAEGPGLDALAAAVVRSDGRERALGAAALGKLAPDRAAALSARVIDDQVSLERLLAGHEADAREALRAAAMRVHTQGTALPLLIAGGDVEGLGAALADRALSEAVRLGAIEALAKIATDAARAPILAIATAKDEDEELRKAAWRALRRARRYKEKKQRLSAAVAQREVSR
jgi:ParB family transcriptional regulator, chromosome partitioning protein